MINDIRPDNVDFTALVTRNNSGLKLDFQTKMINHLKDTFTDSEQQWYIANFYVYLHYHPTNDYPINLDNIYRMLGFTTKGNAKRTLENNFTSGEDYKLSLIKSDKREIGGSMLEEIMLNIDTFKTLCMIIKTDKGKEIRKYYVKLENIFNKIINEQKLDYENQIREQQKVIEQTKNEIEIKDKLLEEKDLSIAKLKKEEKISILYIAHNPLIENLYKIGITSNDIFQREEQHRSSNPGFENKFTYSTEHFKKIEALVKLLLKPFSRNKPEWFNCNYTQIKQVVDFCISMYDTYHISDSVENLTEFISRYRSNRLVNSNKARVIIEKDVYQKYIEECVVYGTGFKVTTEMLCDDFYNWYKLKYPEASDYSHIKLQTNNWSTEFQKEITKTIESVTGLVYIHSSGGGISITDKKRGIYHAKSSGFRGFELKSMNKTVEYFPDEIYQKYVSDFIKVTSNPINKVARVEIIEHFLSWIKKHNIINKIDIYSKSEISSVFKSLFIEKIENITGLKIQNICKLNYQGCFVGMIHKDFNCIGNKSSEKIIISEEDHIKKLIDSWIHAKNNTNIALLFKEIKQEGVLSNENVKKIMNNGYVSLNPNKNKWNLIFRKDDDNHYLTEEAKEYLNEIN